ncbi:hypothetical protein GCM10009557_37790 [Virgisporangium ochraceum]
MTAPRGLVLDDEQFRRLATYGQVEHVDSGRNLYTSGDDSYDFFLVLTAAVDILRDATATEPERLIYRGGPGDFLGELNLLTGQKVYLTARVVTAGTVVRIGAAALRRVLAEQDDIADLLLAAFRERREVFRTAAGSALTVVGRTDEAATLRLRTYLTQMLLPHAWHDADSPAGRSVLASGGLTAPLRSTAFAVWSNHSSTGSSVETVMPNRPPGVVPDDRFRRIRPLDPFPQPGPPSMPTHRPTLKFAASIGLYLNDACRLHDVDQVCAGD